MALAEQNRRAIAEAIAEATHPIKSRISYAERKWRRGKREEFLERVDDLMKNYPDTNFESQPYPGASIRATRPIPVVVDGQTFEVQVIEIISGSSLYQDKWTGIGFKKAGDSETEQRSLFGIQQNIYERDMGRTPQIDTTIRTGMGNRAASNSEIERAFSALDFVTEELTKELQ